MEEKNKWRETNSVDHIFYKIFSQSVCSRTEETIHGKVFTWNRTINDCQKKLQAHVAKYSIFTAVNYMKKKLLVDRKLLQESISSLLLAQEIGKMLIRKRNQNPDYHAG